MKRFAFQSWGLLEVPSHRGVFPADCHVKLLWRESAAFSLIVQNAPRPLRMPLIYIKLKVVWHSVHGAVRLLFTTKSTESAKVSTCAPAAALLLSKWEVVGEVDTGFVCQGCQKGKKKNNGRVPSVFRVASCVGAGQRMNLSKWVRLSDGCEAPADKKTVFSSCSLKTGQTLHWSPRQQQHDFFLLLLLFFII